ncbi:MAG: hypothetical protein QME32_05570 [Endomicrobiia bacterium]|nr:hypothetical protein [Endomicrobiia bacterium]
MPKVKKFNLKLSVYQIQQSLRRKKFPFSDETIQEISGMCSELMESVSTAVHFDTFRDPSSVGLKCPTPDAAVALSVVASTIGDAAEDFMSRRADSSEVSREIAAAVVSHAAHEAKRFAWKIISDEAALDKCELTEKTPVTDAESLAAIKDFLGKIDIFSTENGLKPVYSFVESACWMPIKKKKSGS